MPSLVDDFEWWLSQKYSVQRQPIKDAERVTATSVDQRAHLDFFNTGTIRVSGTDCPLKSEVAELCEKVRADPQFFQKARAGGASVEALTPEQAVLTIIGRELYDFLPEHDRRAVCAAFQVLSSVRDLPDFSPATMPVSRAYEGFLANVLVRVGVCTPTAVQDPSFNFLNAFDSADAKRFKMKVGTHAAELEAAKQRLKEFRHIHLHSQSSQSVQCRTHEQAERFVKRVLNDMQGLFDYFKTYFI